MLLEVSAAQPSFFRPKVRPEGAVGKIATEVDLLSRSISPSRFAMEQALPEGRAAVIAGDPHDAALFQMFRLILRYVSASDSGVTYWEETKCHN